MQETREIPHVPFTEDMKKDYTILVPNMLPVQLKLITSIMKNYGYNMEVLETEGPQIAECGLKNVHNDTCYPALLVIGQFIDALESGKYDLHKVALMITQTGGGCRASNYIHLLRKALIKNGMGYIPVISLNFSGLEKNANPGFKLTRKAFIQVAYGVLLGDFIMHIFNQCRPYEVHKGDCQKAVDELFNKITKDFRGDKLIRYKYVRMMYVLICKRFAQIEMENFGSKRKSALSERFMSSSLRSEITIWSSSCSARARSRCWRDCWISVYIVSIMALLTSSCTDAR